MQIKVRARVHQNLIWTRQRQANQLRSMLREFYPAALHAVDDLAGRDALVMLAAATAAQIHQAFRSSTSKRHRNSSRPTAHPPALWRPFSPR